MGRGEGGGGDRERISIYDFAEEEEEEETVASKHSVILNSAFPSFLRQECFVETPESVWVPFLLLGLLELCQLAYLQY